MAIHYPKTSPPAPGSVKEIATGIGWLRMPLPFDLNHINLYLVGDAAGWFIIDTGLATDVTREAWLRVIDSLSGPVKGIIVTHMHPDHIGLAGWISESHRVPLWMTQVEYFTARALFSGAQEASRWQEEAYFHRAGLPVEQVNELLYGTSGFKNIVSPIPLAYNRMREHQILEMGGNHWEIMIGRGHSPEHAALYCQELHILLAGDHILPEISPNIGVYSSEPDANPLRDYLQTLEPFLSLPEQTLVLPAHNLPFYGLHERINTLKQHHHRHLHALLKACQRPQKVVDCLPIMFNRKLNHRNMFFAVAECMAHLNYLYFEQQISRRTNKDGVYEYETVASNAGEASETPLMDFLKV